MWSESDDEELTLKTSSSLSLRGGSLTLINLFDMKFMCFTAVSLQDKSFILFLLVYCVGYKQE